ncbi:hypothetical protein [Streptomyces sp. NPDC051554]|uniref:hypothetical protein n=1 Tax=Streptomyces sp. NPDC051554 TaxID=3365656 RepID=UPI0037BDEC33
MLCAYDQWTLQAAAELLNSSANRSVAARLRGAHGLVRHLTQRLLAHGENVVDAPASATTGS